MLAITFDTLACFKKLRRSGFTENQAEIITEVISDICYTTSLEYREKEAKNLERKTMSTVYWIGAMAIIVLICEIILMK